MSKARHYRAVGSPTDRFSSTELQMVEYVEIPLSDLLLDMRNARLRDEGTTQQATLLALARQQGKRLLRLARDIVEK